MINKIKRLTSSGTARDTLLSMVGSVGTAVGGMLFTVIVARSMVPEQFGIFSALWALAILLSSLGDLGISSALINFLPKIKSDKSSILTVTFWVQVIASTSFLLLVLLSIPVRRIIIPETTGIQFVLAGAITAVFILETFTFSILAAERRFKFLSLLQIVDSAGKLMIVFGLFLTHHISIELALFSNILSAILATIIGFSGELKHISFLFPKIYFKKIYEFSKWIAVGRIFSVAVARVDILLLASFANSYQAGIFAAASRIALVFSLLASTLGNVTSPRFSGFTTSQQVVSYLKKLTLMVCGIAVIMILIAIFSKPIVLLIFGAKYVSSIVVFRYLCLAMIPFLFELITVNPIIYYFNQPSFIAVVTAIQVTILIILDILLIPKFGAIAPSISLAISNIVVLITTGAKLKSLLKKGLVRIQGEPSPTITTE